jgi:RHS repeat-associated protein
VSKPLFRLLSLCLLSLVFPAQAYGIALGGLLSVTTGYDANNNVIQITERLEGKPDRITRTIYDEFDRPAKVTDPYGAEVRYSYDGNGNRTLLVAQDARLTQYSFDALNRLSTIGGAGGSVGYTYDASGLVTKRGYGNGVIGTVGYDAAGRPVSITYTQGSLILNRTEYAYDQNGNRTLERINRPGGAQRTDYSFDALDRLVGTTLKEGGTTTHTAWSHDPVGNRTGETVTRTESDTSPETTSRQYSYDERNQLTQIGQSGAEAWVINLNYDLQGNLVQKESGNQITTYAWDGNDQLVAVSQNGTLLGKYRYNALGLRVVKEATDPIHPGAPPVMRYTFWDDDAPIQEIGESGEVVARYEFAGREPIGLIHREDGQQNLHPDGLGSIVLVSSSSGNIHRETLFDSWGNILVESGVPANQLGYTGHLMDAETGLIYMQARYYDPEIGRFISMDPAEGNPDTPASYHRYLYAYGNPTIYIDPDGQSATVVGTALGAAWGFGQMAGGMFKDLLNGESRSTGDYFSIWGQNIAGGAAIGASIDVAAMSGGLAFPAAGALGTAGMGALSFGGQAKKWDQFAKDAGVDGVYGALGGYAFGKAMPLVEKPLGKAASWSGEHLGKAAARAAETKAGQWAGTQFERAVASAPMQNAIGAAQRFGNNVAEKLTYEGTGLAVRQVPVPPVNSVVAKGSAEVAAKGGNQRIHGNRIKNHH